MRRSARKSPSITDGLFTCILRRTGRETMNRTSMRILWIAFFLTLIILGTLAGLTIAAFNTQSAMTPMDAPASAQIAEDGSCYQFSFFGQHFTLPRFPVKEVEDVINRYPVLIPKSIVFFTYGADFLSDYLE